MDRDLFGDDALLAQQPGGRRSGQLHGGFFF